MPPGGHSAWSLAATFTTSPWTSVPSGITSPTLMPTRKRMARSGGWSPSMIGHLLLHLHRTAHRPVNAVEHDEEGVAACIDDPAAMLLDRWVDQVLGAEPAAVQASQRHPGRSSGCSPPCRHRATATSFRRSGGFPVGSGALVSDIVSHPGVTSTRQAVRDTDYLPPRVALRER